MKKIVAVILFLFATISVADTLPNAAVTPGATRSATLAEICVKGAAGRARNVTTAVKQSVYRAYGMKRSRIGYCSGPQGCEVDHLISLELGGANVPENLWPQPYDGEWNAHMKDKLENRLHALICAPHAAMTIAQAQTMIRTDWIAAYKTVIGTP